MAYEITSWGLREARELAKKFGIDEAAMIEARRLLEEKQAAEHAVINANIRSSAGYGPSVADAQPDAAGEEGKRPLPSANAGAGLTGPAPDVETTGDKMNRWLRARGRGFA